MSRTLRIGTAGALVSVQDLGRPGYAHLGVPRSGAADRGAHALAQRLVGNLPQAAGIEITAGTLSFTVETEVFAVLTGAPAQVWVNRTPVGHQAGFVVPTGSTVRIDSPATGLRSYLAVRGGIDVPTVLGSRSTDTLSGLGPAPLAAGDVVRIGGDSGDWPPITEAPALALPDPIVLWANPGPRADALLEPDDLLRRRWVVNPASNRIGVRLDPVDGEPLRLHPGADSLASEGIAMGSIQIPPGGQPVLFLADHPVTGGYPVVAVLRPESVDLVAQLRPGTRVRFRHP